MPALLLWVQIKLTICVSWIFQWWKTTACFGLSQIQNPINTYGHLLLSPFQLSRLFLHALWPRLHKPSAHHLSYFLKLGRKKLLSQQNLRPKSGFQIPWSEQRSLYLTNFPSLPEVKFSKNLAWACRNRATISWCCNHLIKNVFQ